MGVGGSRDEDKEEIVRGLSGYRVMKVFEGSPAARAGLRPFEDFVMRADKKVLAGVEQMGDERAPSLYDLVKHHENKELELDVWNTAQLDFRKVTLRPASWGDGHGLLGAAVRLEECEDASNGIWHVIDVQPQSPASDAGLMPSSDYLLGTPRLAFRHDSDLHNLLRETHKARAVVTLCVYSSATDRVREVEISPSSSWGGVGLLGCDLASGLLHRLPSRMRRPEEPKG